MKYLTVRFLTLFLLLFSLPSFGSGGQAIQINDSICLLVEVYTKPGCPHCVKAKAHLKQVQVQHPDIKVMIHNIKQREALHEFEQLNQQLKISRPGVPMYVACGKYFIGFDEHSTPKWLNQILLNDHKDKGNNSVTLPIIGELSITDAGLPLFTVAVGLVDGFNPCAMWVLLFLLSLLIHLHNSGKMLLIASIFVVTSGVVYFGFMAAWLNLFLVIGFSKNIQFILGGLGIIIALVNIKDFFAFKQGVSLSFPESAKHGFYARIRKIVQAENLWFAIPGIITIAILVNFLELLCTAGLPALYTKILTNQSLTSVQYYGYLALYNVAYIIDDALMVALAIVGVRKAKLNVVQGQWLKLVSGVVIFLLALFLILEPS